MALRQAIASTSKLLAPQQGSLIACTCHVRASPLSVAPLQTRGYAVSRGGKTPVQQLRDEAIRPRLVRLVQDATEGGGLSAIRNRDQVLRQMDRTKFWLVQGE